MARRIKLVKESGGKISEAVKGGSSGVKKYPVVIISEGMGNLADRNYYTASAIKSGEKIYEGKQAYLDHPTERQEEEQPGRSVNDMFGHYEDCKAVKGEGGLLELRAMLVPVASKTNAIGLIDHSITYKQKYPDNDFVGISINGSGDGQEMDYDEFVKTVKPNAEQMQKIKQVEGQSVNVINQFTDGFSADLVTAAGARGRVLRESQKQRRFNMFNWLKKYFEASQKGDKKLMKEAAKHLQAKEGKHDKEAGALAKHVMNCKKEMKKKEGEEEEAYEARVLAAAMSKQSEAAEADEEEADEDDKEADSKKPGSGGADDETDEADEEEAEEGESDEEESDEAEEADEEESDEAEEDDGDGDADDSDKKDDKKPAPKKGEKKEGLAAMQKQMKQMQQEIESLKKEKKEAQKESANHKIKTSLTEKAKEIDAEMAKSGLPRKESKHLVKLFNENTFTKEERKTIIESAKKLADQVRDEEVSRLFAMTESGGFPEVQPTNENTASNDDVFGTEE